MFEADTVWKYSMSDRLKFGPGAAAELPYEITSRDCESVLIITNNGVRDAGIIDDVTSRFPDHLSYDLFAEVEPDPSAELMERAGRVARDLGPIRSRLILRDRMNWSEVCCSAGERNRSLTMITKSMPASERSR